MRSQSKLENKIRNVKQMAFSIDVTNCNHYAARFVIFVIIYSVWSFFSQFAVSVRVTLNNDNDNNSNNRNIK